MQKDLHKFCVSEGVTMREAIACLDRSRLGIVLIVSGDGRLHGTITDGDARRFALAGSHLDADVETVLTAKKGTHFEHPITGSVDLDRADWWRLLKEHNILHLPIVDSEERVVGLVTRVEFEPEDLPQSALIMAGGFGKRLHPLTADTPKAMLPIGDRPLLEIMIEQLRNVGVGRVHLATHHQSEKISDYFGDGTKLGVEITYVDEDRPLGTAGALGLIEPPTKTLLVVNGDILTDLDFRAFMAFHREHAADLTLAVRRYDFEVPYGVVECDGAEVRNLSEKPVQEYLVNAGIYLLEPVVYEHIDSAEPLDMTELIQRLLGRKRPVASFPIREYWLDIGEHNQYEEARSWAANRETKS